MKTLRQLDKENKKNLRLLPPAMQEELGEMFRHLRYGRISSYDSAQISADLIAMALDAHNRGEGLQDVIGDDRQAFCMQLAENARPKSAAESVLLWLRHICSWLFIGPLLELLTYRDGYITRTGVWHTLSVTPRQIILVAGMCFFYCAARYYYRLAYRSDRVQVLFVCGIFAAYAVVNRVATALSSGAGVLFRVAYEPALLVALGIWLATEFLYQRSVAPPPRQAGSHPA